MKNLGSWQVLRESRRHQYWRAALVGLGAGMIALLFARALSFTEGARVALLTYLYTHHPTWGWLVLPLVAGGIGALVAWITARFAPEAAGSGIPHVKGALIHINTFSWKRVLPVKFIGGALCIGAGFSLGREGPTVQLGAAMGRMLGDLLKVPPKAAPRLLACGAGAGLAAAFHAPLAGFIFVIEELQREFSALTYTMALIAAVAADIIATSYWGSDNVFRSSGFPAASLSALPFCVVLGVVAGICGAGFNQSLLRLQDFSHTHLRMPAWGRGLAAGVLVGLAAWWVPELAGGGHTIVERMIQGEHAAPASAVFLLVLFAGKFVLTLVSYLARVPGGIFAPMLVMGASLGLYLGIVASVILPSVVPIPESFTPLGMAAFFAAVVRAPLTGVVLVLEMTGDYRQLLPLLVTAMVAFMLSERLGIRPIYEALLAQEVHRAKPDIPMHWEPVLVEFVVQEESEMDGKAIQDIPLPERCLLVTIARHGHEILPGGGTLLHRGDHVTAVVSGADAAEAVSKLLALSKV